MITEKEIKKNPFALYDKSDRDEATKKLDKAISLFGEMYRQIREAHPDVGIGDTETDEMISDEVYSEIHSYGGRY
tara:strand:- start:2216 stop:2440 length:225 start_codon:yes stop_codon:yes gene_type:complete